VIEAVKRDLAGEDKQRRKEAAGLGQQARHWGGKDKAGNLAELVPELARILLTDKDRDVKVRCLTSLEAIGKKAEPARDAIMKAISGSDEYCQRCGLMALEKIGAKPDDIELLTKALSSNIYNTRNSAGRMLARLGPKGVSILIERINSVNKYERQASVTGLGWAGKHGKPAVKPLIKFIEKTINNKDDHEPSLALRSLQYLKKTSEEAVPLLTKLLEDNRYGIKRGAAAALGSIGASARPALPSLQKLLNDKDKHIRATAANAIEKIEAKQEK
jgi:HEAT repeat protein